MRMNRYLLELSALPWTCFHRNKNLVNNCCSGDVCARNGSSTNKISAPRFSAHHPPISLLRRIHPFKSLPTLRVPTLLCIKTLKSPSHYTKIVAWFLLCCQHISATSTPKHLFKASVLGIQKSLCLFSSTIQDGERYEPGSGYEAPADVAVHSASGKRGARLDRRHTRRATS
jgi:hypothetical protein